MEEAKDLYEEDIQILARWKSGKKNRDDFTTIAIPQIVFYTIFTGLIHLFVCIEVNHVLFL